MTPEELGYKDNRPLIYKKYVFDKEIIITVRSYKCSGYSKWEGILEFNESSMIVSQDKIDRLQIAFNNLQRDLKILNEEK